MTTLDSDEACGKTYELGGPGVYSFRELMELMMAHTKRSRVLVDIPFWMAEMQAMVLEMVPKPLLTRDQVELLRADNVVANDALGLAELGIEPSACEAVLPTYLDRFRPGGRYNRSRVRI